MSQEDQLNQRKTASLAELEAATKLFPEGSEEFDALADLQYALENDRVPGQSLITSVLDVRLRINMRDDLSAVLDKIDAFILELRKKKGVETARLEAAVKGEAESVHTAAESVASPLVPEKEHTEWRDVNTEIEKLANAFALAGKPQDEAKLRELRKKSHKRQLGKEDYSIVVGGEGLQLFDDDSDDKVLVKLTKFVSAVRKNNPELENKIVTAAPAEKKDDDIEPIFWRDVVAGIDALIKAYPDEDFSAVADLRDSLQRGEIGAHDRLLLSVGTIYLNIKKADDPAMMKEKIAVFIGELKQVASMGKKGKEKALDPALSKTYWRDILGAMKELEAAYGQNPQFKLLKLSIEKGILGTVKNFHATIGGVTLDIQQSDTDLEMQDKLTKFIRELTTEGQVKISDDVRRDFAKLEQEYHELEKQKQDLDSRYRDVSSDMNKSEKKIRRLENDNATYEAEIKRLQAELQRAQASTYTPPPSRYTSRSYGG
jgi:hypothetical protein